MNTRGKITIAAVTLFIEQGIARTTTKEIAASAGVAEGSIYRYFRSKDEMAWQVFDEYHQALAEQLLESIKKQTNLINKVSAMVHCFLLMADKDWLMFRYYLTSQHTHMSKVERNVNTPYKVVLNIIEELSANKQIEISDTQVVASMVMGAVHQIGINKIYGRINGELIEYEKVITETIMKMLNVYEG